MNKMKKKGIFRRIALGAAAMTMLVSAVSCGRSERTGRIAVICKNDSVVFWDQVKTGAEDACKELTLNFDYYCATSDNDFASQIDYINQAIEKKSTAIIIAPNTTVEANKEFKAALERADAAGIKIININSNSGFENAVSTISSNDRDCGRIAARNSIGLIVEKNGNNINTADLEKMNSSKIGIIPHTSATATNRSEGFKDQMISLLKTYNEKIGNDEQDEADYRFLFIEPSEGYATEEQAHDAALKMIESNPDLVMIYATNTNTTLGVCRAISEKGYNEKISVVGFNSDENEITYLKTGALDGIVIQNPYLMGYTGVTYAYRSTSDRGNEILPKTLDTGATYVNQDNLSSEYIQLLIYPERY